MGSSEGEAQDWDVITRVVEGDVNAFELLVDRHKARVFGIVYRHVPGDRVEDVAQEVFLEAFRSLKSFSGASPLDHWLSRIAVRCCADFWQRRRGSRETPVSSLSPDSEAWLEKVLTAPSREAFHREAARKEAAEVLAYALDRLSPEDRMALTLVHLEGCSAKQAAELLGWSTISVRVRTHRSKKKLRKILSDLLGNRRGET
ncbi:MAG TPA: sigma-70 family RNA polymerase sigma factor [Syntrophobacteraceae bacterium]|nr:sigma-70 family RNA polymerase sigma factor [Syntrophobacteraceae bacterium]